jgi:hypothetical protein
MPERNPHHSGHTSESERLGELISELAPMLSATRRKVNQALRLSTDRPEQREVLSEFDALLRAPAAVSRRLTPPAKY